MIDTDVIASNLAVEMVEAAERLMASDFTAAKGEVPEAFKKEWKNKDKDGDGKESEPKPDFLKDKEKKSSDDASRVRLTARTKKAGLGYNEDDYPYAALTFGKGRIEFRISFGPTEESGADSTGAEPYRHNVPKAIATVFKVLKMNKVSDKNIEIIA